MNRQFKGQEIQKVNILRIGFNCTGNRGNTTWNNYKISFNVHQPSNPCEESREMGMLIFCKQNCNLDNHVREMWKYLVNVRLSMHRIQYNSPTITKVSHLHLSRCLNKKSWNHPDFSITLIPHLVTQKTHWLYGKIYPESYHVSTFRPKAPPSTSGTIITTSDWSICFHTCCLLTNFQHISQRSPIKTQVRSNYSYVPTVPHFIQNKMISKGHKSMTWSPQDSHDQLF